MQQTNIDPINVRLGLPGLPELTDSLVVGGLYLLIAETASARFPVLAASLANGLDSGLNCRLLLQQNPETLVDRMQSFGNLDISQAIQDRKLQLFTIQDEFSKKMFRHGAEAFVQELEHFAFPDGSFVVFDQADELLALHDVLIALDQVEVLKKWAQSHRVTFLLVLTRTTAAHASTVNALMDNLTGIARLGVQRNGLELTFDYWQSTEGTTAGRSFALKQRPSGLYEAGVVQAFTDGEVVDAPFEKMDGADAQIFYMDPNLRGFANQAQAQWQFVDTLIGMMHATRNIRSATCILLFEKGSQLRQLAETVHTLRLTLGRYARIVVQEKEASLRYQNEALLLKLGLNLVINRDVPLSRLPLLLDSLKGQIFSRDVDINFEAALASVLPTQLHGYLMPARFVREAILILERAEMLSVPCAMMIGQPSESLSLSELMSHNRISRAGDLITADTQDCYIFLNACPQAVLLSTLERLIGQTLDDAFTNVRFVVNPAEIQAELAALSRAASTEILPDYTSESEQQPEVLTVSQADPIRDVQESKSIQSAASAPQSPIKPRIFKESLSKPIVRPPARVISPAPEITNAAKKFAPIEPASKVVTLPQGSDAIESLFDYDASFNASAFGKTEAPRATRAALRK
ncbi:MAG: cellulose biosynthesis protein BcsE [Comamonadaceae bacterium]|nr:MAG: cellulose biosynthesis protein BcsE [Comamonadaceae bacterium]